MIFVFGLFLTQNPQKSQIGFAESEISTKSILGSAKRVYSHTHKNT